VDAAEEAGGAKARLYRYVGMPFVQSSALESLAYDESGHRLRATFRGSGRTYEYEDVPQDLYDALIFSDSIGAFFNSHIRDRFPFHEV
jgi:hypothetical protein